MLCARVCKMRRYETHGVIWYHCTISYDMALSCTIGYDSLRSNATLYDVVCYHIEMNNGILGLYVFYSTPRDIRNVLCVNNKLISWHRKGLELPLV